MKHEADRSARTPDEIIAEIARLMNEAEALVAGPVAGPIAEKFVTLRERLVDLEVRVAEVYGDARRKVLRAARVTDEAIQTHPYKSVAIALGVGVLLGAVLRSDRE